MKRLLLNLSLLALVICFPALLFAQTAGTLTFKFTPVSHTGYAGTKNVLAVWIQSGTGSFIKTKLRYAGSITKDHLPIWAVNSGGTSANCLSAACNKTDATTGATLSSFTTKTITWDGKNVNGTANGTIVADGTYKVTIEECWNHGAAGKTTRSFTFTKGPNEDHQTPANDANFTDITLDWVPTAMATGTVSGSPFCGNASINVPYTITGTYTAGNVFSAQLSDSTGAFASPTVIGTSASISAGTINAVIPVGTTAGTGYRIRVVSSMPPITGTDNGSDLTIDNCVVSSISTSDVSGSPFCNSTSYNTSVGFSTIGTFISFFDVQLSDSVGSFATPVIIGSGTSSPINATIPPATLPGIHYRIRVVNTSMLINGSDNGTDLIINSCPPPGIVTLNVAGSPFCSNTSYSTTVGYTTTGTFTGSFDVQLSDSSGSFTNSVIIGSGTSSPIGVTIPYTTTTGAQYRMRVVNLSLSSSGTNNGADIEINTCLSIDSINRGPFCSMTGYSINVPFSISGQNSNSFFIELSDSAGTFINGGTIIGMGTGSPVTANVPSATISGSHYRIRVKNLTKGLYGEPSNSIAINTCGGLGFMENKEENYFYIHPNPNQGEFTVSYDLSKPQGISILVTDIIGSVIASGSYNTVFSKGTIDIQLSDISQGIYFVKVYGSDFNELRKIVIN